MKKLVALLLAIVMVVGIFAGCNTEKPVETKPQETQGGTNKPAETKPAETKPTEPTTGDPQPTDSNNGLIVGIVAAVVVIGAVVAFLLGKKRKG